MAVNFVAEGGRGRRRKSRKAGKKSATQPAKGKRESILLWAVISLGWWGGNRKKGKEIVQACL